MRISLRELRRIIREAAYSGIFNKGDNILWGKYKNKRGKIKDVYKDDKDHPTIEIEPTPKGRKKNVTMGLYKIWQDKQSDDKDLDEVDTDPSNNPGRPDDAFEYLGMHPSPTAAMAHPAASGATTGSESEAESESSTDGASSGPQKKPTEGT